MKNNLILHRIKGAEGLVQLFLGQLSGLALAIMLTLRDPDRLRGPCATAAPSIHKGLRCVR
ncbi:MAG: hypothetical protein ACP5QG_01295 [candidate division WOR-3 bacterium]